MRVYGKKSWLSTAAPFCIMSWLTCGWMLMIGTTIYLLFTKYYWISVLALGRSLLDNAQNRDGRRLSSLRHLPLFRWFRDYFPINLVKAAELCPDHNYILGYHPHGYVAIGAICSFMTEALNVSATFPGLVFHTLTTRLAYVAPLYREWFLLLGGSNVSEQNIRYIASKGPGNALVIVVGGAAEIMESRPGMSRLVLKDRKGFAKIALETGSHLVPVYSFGENDVYLPYFSNPTGSFTRTIQEWTKTLTRGLPPVFMYGPSKWSGPWLPLSKPISVVVGKPIAVLRKPDPSETEIDELHEKYLNSLRDLFEEQKDRFGYGNVALEFV